MIARRRLPVRPVPRGHASAAFSPALGIAAAAPYLAGECAAARTAGGRPAVSGSVSERSAGGSGRRAAGTGAGVRRSPRRKRGADIGYRKSQADTRTRQFPAASADRADTGCAGPPVRAGWHHPGGFSAAPGARRYDDHRAAAARRRSRADARHDRLDLRPCPVDASAPRATDLDRSHAFRRRAWTGSQT